MSKYATGSPCIVPGVWEVATATVVYPGLIDTGRLRDPFKRGWTCSYCRTEIRDPDATRCHHCGAPEKG